MNLRSIVLTVLFLFVFVYLSKGLEKGRVNDGDILLEKYSDLAWKNMKSDPDSAIFYGKKLKSLADQIDDNRISAKAYYAIGMAYCNKKLYDIAALYFFDGLNVIKNRMDKVGDIRRKFFYSGLGDIYEDTYSYDLALNYHSKALEIAREYNQKKHIALLTYYIGIIYEKKKEFSNAKIYYKKAITNIDELENKNALAKVFNSLGNVYFEQSKYDSARLYFSKAFDECQNIKSLESNRAIYLGNIGESYYQQQKFGEAEDYFLRALSVSKDHNDIKRIKWLYYNLGNLYNAEGEHYDAIYYYEKTISLAENDVIDEYYKKSCKQLSETYHQLGNFEKAFNYNNQYLSQIEKIDKIKEDLQQQNARYRMKEVEWQRQIQEKERKIAGVETENLWTKIIIGITLIVLAVAAYKIYIYSKKIAQVKMIIYSDEV